MDSDEALKPLTVFYRREDDNVEVWCDEAGLRYSGYDPAQQLLDLAPITRKILTERGDLRPGQDIVLVRIPPVSKMNGASDHGDHGS